MDNTYIAVDAEVVEKKYWKTSKMTDRRYKNESKQKLAPNYRESVEVEETRKALYSGVDYIGW